MSLSQFHGFEDSVRWRLTNRGVDIDGSGVERTRGAPATVTRIWDTYADLINDVARKTRVPCELIIATICTESSGRADSVRLEPGYKDDESTPNKISAGLMQTLISTARETMQMSLGRQWLLDPYNSILAGTSYIAQQARKTLMDPPLVAAAYNAGGIYLQNGKQNRWKLRQYPIGTGKHCDRFVQFFNDAVFVLSNHTKQAAVRFINLQDSETTPRPKVAAQEGREIEIQFAENANRGDVTEYSLVVLKSILSRADLRSAMISSTSRDSYNQARVMFNNLEKYGIAHQKQLYGPAGDKVIDVYAKVRGDGGGKEETILAMKQKIIDVGPINVSRHASEPRVLNVFDVAPSSICNKQAFEKCVQSDSRVSTFFMPPRDPGYHLEIPQPKT